MRVLFSTGSSESYMMPPRLSDEQVVCGPDWKDARDAQGRVTSLATPAGRYDLFAVAQKLPPEQAPDVVVCLVDASWRNVPQNLAAFTCPKVLFVADTHHLNSPLLSMLQYAASEPYDRLVLLYDRHHAPLFHAAGFRNLFWLPCFTFPHSDAAVRASWQSGPRLPHLTFVGQVGKFHPRRMRLVRALRNAGLPFNQQALGQREGLGCYGSSLLGFNASLNGDLNLRVFEILASGARLVTDRLAPGSGLEYIIGSGEGARALLYGGTGELCPLVAGALANPSATQAAGRAGAQWFLDVMGEEKRRAMFRAVAFDGRAAEAFPLPEAELSRVHFPSTQSLVASTIVYEAVQELHRVGETVRVFQDATLSTTFGTFCETLPRVQVSGNPLLASSADLAVAGIANAAAVLEMAPANLWVQDCPEAQLPALSNALAPLGYVPASRSIPFFANTRPGVDGAAAPAELARQAREAFDRKNSERAQQLASAALRKDGGCVPALTLLAEMALESGDAALAETHLKTALAQAPGDEGLTVLLVEALLRQERHAELAPLAEKLLARTSASLVLAQALSVACEKLGQGDRAIRVLRACLERNPSSVETAVHLAQLFRRSGQMLTGLDLQRRLFGCQTPIPSVDPAKRRVRVGFLMQHPQGWTGLESVWRSMRDDPAFEAIVFAAPYDHPYAPEGGREAVYGFLEKEGVPYRRWDAAPMTPGFVDVMFVQNPYDVTRPAALQTPNLLKYVARLAYIPYGLEIGGGEENASNQFNQLLQQTAWAWFARSPRHRAMIEKHCVVGASHVVVTGHPRLDVLSGLDRMPADPEFKAFAKGRKMIFWNPQFDIRPNDTGFSTFLKWQEFFLEEFARRQDVAFVIRPHPLFFGTLESRQIWTRAQVDDFLARVQAAGNVLIDRRPSYLPVFAASDAMLSDASSFLLEYGATGRPLLYLHNPTGPSLNEDGEFVRAHNYTALERGDVTDFISMVAEGRDPLGEGRRASYGEVMTCPPGGVAKAVKTHILTQLAQEARQNCR